MESEWVSAFDEFVDDEEFVVADDDDDCVSWLFAPSEADVSHSTPACVAWTSDSLVESKKILDQSIIWQFSFDSRLINGEIEFGNDDCVGGNKCGVAGVVGSRWMSLISTISSSIDSCSQGSACRVCWISLFSLEMTPKSTPLRSIRRKPRFFSSSFSADLLESCLNRFLNWEIKRCLFGEFGGVFNV